ncbi:MAG TPA: tetratricopeptide repeat protein [Candidatus Krumholzibacteriaceae bacterium]|nr:tetratricopeptide repeat protein [Candidatus Krumholzibacteriaceae bacterium]
MSISTTSAHFIFILLLLFASFICPDILWAASWWSYISLTGLVILSLISVIFITSKPSEFIRKKSACCTLNKSLCFTLSLSVSAVLMWVFRVKTPLHGDIYSTAKAIERGAVNLPGSFVPTAINQLFYRVTNAIFLAGSSVSLNLTSIISGLIFIAGAYSVTGIIFDKSYRGRSLLTLLFVSNGCFAVFFGGGNIPMAVLFSFLYVIAILKYIKTEVSLIPSALLLLLSIFSHPSAIYLLPGFIYILISALISKNKKRDAVAAFGIFIILWIAGEIILPVITEYSAPAKYISSLLTPNFQRWTLANSVLNITNCLVLAGPIFIAALFLFIRSLIKENADKNTDWQHKLITTNLISAILLIILANGSVDGGLKWSALFATATVFPLYFAVEIKKIRDISHLFKMTLLITISGLIHLLPIVLAGSSLKTAEQRLLSLPLIEGRGEYIIAESARENYNIEKAVKYFSRAAEKDPENDRAYYKLAEIRFDQEEYYEAAGFFTKAAELTPGNHHYRFRLAETYIEIRWYNKAVPILEKLTSGFPDSASYWTRLGYAYNHSKKFSKAVTAYNRALSLDPDNRIYKDNLASATINRGSELQQNGNIEAARENYYKAIKLAPDRCEGYTNLATIELDRGNYREARKLLSRALRNPTITARTYFIMGIVMEKLGKYEEAVYYLDKCKNINPMSPASYHIKRIKAKIEKESN